MPPERSQGQNAREMPTVEDDPAMSRHSSDGEGTPSPDDSEEVGAAAGTVHEDGLAATADRDSKE